MTSESQDPEAVLEVSPASRVGRAPELRQSPDVPEDLSLPRSIPLNELPFSIGRGDENDALIQDRGMSRRSIEITGRGGRFEVIDLGQRQGVLVNGTPVAERRLLQFDDVITFPNADVKITLRKPSKPAEPESDDTE